MALSTEQVLLLENLTYTHSGAFPGNSISQYEGMTVGDYISQLKEVNISSYDDAGSYMTGKDWDNMIRAIENDPALMRMEIATTHVDQGKGGGDGFSAVFVDRSSKEAVVAFKGTEGSAEWKDNFQGISGTGQPDGVSTQHQANALEWYQDAYKDCGLDDCYVTVTGHSKGGNKAKYITLLDGSVDRCLSFDGQGFSDEFMDKYADEISMRQSKIENHNADYDFVSPLLNDVGEQHYYEGQDIGNGGGGFMEYHCPNSYLSYDENGNPIMHEVPERGYGIDEVDNLLNSMIRSMPPDMRQDAGDLVNQLRALAMGGKKASMEDYLNLLSASDNKEVAAFIVAYLVEAVQANPDMKDKLNEVLDRFGLSEFREAMEIGVDVVQWEHFDKLVDILGKVGGVVPDWLWQKLIDYLRDKFGIELTIDQIKDLVSTLQLVPGYQEDMHLVKDGSDRKFESVTSSMPIKVDTAAMEEAARRLDDAIRQLDGIVSKAERCRLGRTLGILINPAIRLEVRRMQARQRNLQNMQTTLDSIREKYTRTENNNKITGV